MAAAAAGVYVHPYLLSTRKLACAFCFGAVGVQTHPLKEPIELGWHVCPKEECHRHHLFCVYEHERRSQGRSVLGNSREWGAPDATSSDDEA